MRGNKNSESGQTDMKAVEGGGCLFLFEVSWNLRTSGFKGGSFRMNVCQIVGDWDYWSCLSVLAMVILKKIRCKLYKYD